MAEMPERPEGASAGSAGAGIKHQTTAAGGENTGTRTDAVAPVTMEEVLRAENVEKALRRVKSNKGSPGVDGMSVDELREYLGSKDWQQTRKALLEGQYKPQAVLGVEIPKANGGKRQLGIPTVVDRLIQQAILQAVQPDIDPTFSEHSYGFRPGTPAKTGKGLGLCQLWPLAVLTDTGNPPSPPQSPLRRPRPLQPSPSLSAAKPPTPV